MLSFIDEELWELKEAAKWSLEINERKKAVAKLVSNYGEGALSALSEIKDTTVYDEIKKACIEAILSAKKKATEKGITQASDASSHYPRATNKKSRKRSKKVRRA